MVNRFYQKENAEKQQKGKKKTKLGGNISSRLAG